NRNSTPAGLRICLSEHGNPVPEKTGSPEGRRNVPEGPGIEPRQRGRPVYAGATAMIRYSLLAAGLILLALQAPATDTRRRLQECHKEPVRLVSQAADAASGGQERDAT